MSRPLRRVLGPLTLCTVVFTSACGGNVSPTAPSLDPPPGGAFVSEGSAVISGALSSGGSSATQSGGGAAAATQNVAGVTVTVEGTDIRDVTDARGGFRLIDVPNGTIRLRFTGSGLNGLLVIQAVGPNQFLTIGVAIQSGGVELVSIERGMVERFHGVLDSLKPATPAFSVVDGPTVGIDRYTRWDPTGDLRSFEQLTAAFDGGTIVEIAGNYTDFAGDPLASVITARTLGPAVAFDGLLESISTDGTLSIVDGPMVSVGGYTQWDPAGDLLSFEEIEAAVAAGAAVQIAGSYSVFDGHNFAGSVVARTLAAPTVHFEGVVAGVGRSLRALQLEDGTKIVFVPGTVFEPDSELDSFDEIADEVAAGEFVLVTGQGIPVDGGLEAVSVSATFDKAVTTVVPAQWGLDWATGGTSGPGGDRIQVRTQGRGYENGNPATATLSGPTGVITPVGHSTDASQELLIVEFLKSDAISIVGDVPLGSSAEIFFNITLFGGLEITRELEITVVGEPEELVVVPTAWRADWVAANGSVAGGDVVEVRVEGGRAGHIEPGSVTLAGPAGRISPILTRLASDAFVMEFRPSDAIGILAGIPTGDSARITFHSLLSDGSSLELDEEVSIVHGDARLAEFMAAVNWLIGFIDGLVREGELSAIHATPLQQTLRTLLAKVELREFAAAVELIGTFRHQAKQLVDSGVVTAAQVAEWTPIIWQQVQELFGFGG